MLQNAKNDHQWLLSRKLSDNIAYGSAKGAPKEEIEAGVVLHRCCDQGFALSNNM